MVRVAILAWLLLAFVLPAKADDSLPHPVGISECARVGIEALAKQKGVEAKALPGAEAATVVTVWLHRQNEDRVAIEKSSGNNNLDTIAKNCVSQSLTVYAAPNERIYQKLDWEEVLSGLVPPYAISPTSKGAPHICLADYPAAAVRERRQGTTRLVFTVTAAGTVRDRMIAVSSGHVDLDASSLFCASKWLYNPALANGVPVDTRWTASVAWALGGAKANPVPELLGSFQNCVTIHPDAAERAAPLSDPVTMITYKLTDGHITAVAITKKSGDDTLDAYGSTCVGSWQFKRLNDRGETANGTYAAIIVWKFRQ